VQSAITSRAVRGAVATLCTWVGFFYTIGVGDSRRMMGDALNRVE